jgi:hypothetical protein
VSKYGCILEISFLAYLIDTFPGVGNSDYKATSVEIAIFSLTELGNIDEKENIGGLYLSN